MKALYSEQANEAVEDTEQGGSGANYEEMSE